jgi:hypothetical protein
MSKIRGSGVSLLFMIILFFSLSIFSMLAILTGAKVYENINIRMESNFSEQTALSYITHKVRQADSKGMVSVEKIQGVDVLVLREEYDGTVYQTMIYCIDGYIKELFTDSNSGLSLSDGIEIMECKKLDLEIASDNLIKVELTNEKDNIMYIGLRSGVGGVEY